MRGEEDDDEVLIGVGEPADATKGSVEIVGRGGGIGACCARPAASGERDHPFGGIIAAGKDACGFARLVLEDRLVPEGRGEDIGIDHTGALGRKSCQRLADPHRVCGSLGGRHGDFHRAELAVERIALLRTLGIGCAGDSHRQ